MWKGNTWSSSLDLLRQSWVPAVKHRMCFLVLYGLLLYEVTSFCALRMLNLPHSCSTNPLLAFISGTLNKTGSSRQHGLHLGKKFLFKVTSNAVDLSMTSLQTGTKESKEKILLTALWPELNVIHHLSFSWRKRARGVLFSTTEATQQVLVLSYEERKAWSEEQSRNITAGVLLATWCVHSFTLIFHTVFHREISGKAQ